MAVALQHRPLLHAARRRLVRERAAGAEAAARGRVGRARDVALEHDPARASAAPPGRARAPPTAAPACRGAAATRTAPRACRSRPPRPRYITATRSQRYSTIDRSWVMNRHEKPSSACRSRSRLRIAACTETSSADTGSSAISTLGFSAQRPREPDALALAARQLVRVAVAQLGAQPDLLEQLGDARVELGARGEAVQRAAARRRCRRPSCAGSATSSGSWKTMCSSRRSGRSRAARQRRDVGAR